MILVSKCLTGCPCRYDGRSVPDPEIAALAESGEAVAVCPEQLGGLPTPRVPAELEGTGADVLDGKARAVARDGRDVTREFVSGAFEALRIANEHGIKHAVLKGKSPSCGMGLIYDGSFTGTLHEGDGVTAALLLRNGITVEVR